MKFIFALLLIYSSAWAAGGSASEAGNGGGISEKNILFANDHLPKIIDLCLETSLCRLDAFEAELLKKIRASLEQESKTPIEFRSEKSSPGTFKIDGLLRIARTGDHVGDPIFINQDLLYSTLASGVSSSTDVPLATSILMHELGHHQGVKDHALLDRLGSKLQASLLIQQERSEFWNENAALIVYQFNPVRSDADKRKIQVMDQLLLENRSELYDLTGRLAAKLTCPKTTHVGLRIYNLHEEHGVRFDSKTALLTKPFRGWYIQSCGEGEEADHGDFKILLTFKKIGNEMFQFIPQKTAVEIIGCKTNPEVCK